MVDFDLIKGRIQKHKLSSIVHHSLELLKEIERTDEKNYPIWNILNLLKWAYIHTYDSIIRKPIKQHEFNQLLLLIQDFEGSYPRINFKAHRQIGHFLKIIGYQQFALQDKFHNVILSRQIVIYLQLSSKFDIEKEFERLTAIGLKAFLEYSYCTWLFIELNRLSENKYYHHGDFVIDYFDFFKSKWGNDELSKYLDLLSIKGQGDFKGLQKLHNESLQLYETNFFTLKPFILFRNEYRIPHRSIFVQTIKHFIYNYLKENSEMFPEEFGKRVEKYVGLGLVENKIPCLNEGILKSRYQLSKVCDYLIEEDILVEVKAVEMHPRSGVTRERDILVKDLNTSIIKAYTQLLSTASNIDPDREHFGIVITYKEMLLGFGSDAWEEFLQPPIENFCLQNGVNISVLPPQNLFFITIEDWDKMMQNVKNKKASVKEILLKAKRLNQVSNMAEKVVIMEQVLNNHFRIKRYTLDYLKDIHLQLDIIPHGQDS